MGHLVPQTVPVPHDLNHHNDHTIEGIPYSRKVWRRETSVNLLFLSVWRGKVWQMDR